jgi:hypothetical protein
VTTSANDTASGPARGTATIPTKDNAAVPIRVESGAFNSIIERFKAQSGDVASGQLRETAIETLGKCVEAYASAFGSGEVGAGGTGLAQVRASEKGIIADKTAGLLYGRIQSGKTITSIATTALAADNGFRCIIVLTSDNTWLGRQTYERFREELAEGGPAVRAWTDWEDDPRQFGRDEAAHFFEHHGVVLVSTKNSTHLDQLLKVLRESKAGGVPTLVIDDEADNASLNTRTSQIARHGRSDYEDSPIYDAIGKIRKTVPHHVFLQVTATPQSLLLQKLDERSRPAFCVLSKTGPDYMGGELFFSDNSRYWVSVDDAELEVLRGGEVLGSRGFRIPDGLRRALCLFFAGSCYKILRPDPKRDPGIYSMLVHIDYKQVAHNNVRDVIRRFVRQLDIALSSPEESRERAEAMTWLGEAHSELTKTVKDLPTAKEIAEALSSRIQNALPQIIDANNPEDEPDYRRGMNIIIGGYRLGRGVTVKGLFLTYYGRDAKTKVTDTVLQHARMFGYRRYLLDVTRLFVPERIWTDFQRIHESDEGMRNAIGDNPNSIRVAPVWVGDRLRPTRANVLDPYALGAFVPGRDIFPPDPMWRRGEVRPRTLILDQLLGKYVGDDSKFHEVPIDFLIKLLEQMPSRPMPDLRRTWEDNRVRRALETMKVEPWRLTHGYLNVRTGGGKGLDLSREKNPPFEGMAAGAWTKAAKPYNKYPVLIVMYEKGLRADGWDDQPLYLPTLCMPDSKFVIMFAYR